MAFKARLFGHKNTCRSTIFSYPLSEDSLLTQLWTMQIIQVNLTSLEPQPIKAGAALDFTYSVEWIPTDITFARRFERYLDYNFFEHQVGPQLVVPSHVN